MRKRMTSLLLTLVMLLSLVPAMGVTASAAEPEWTTVYSYAELQTAVKAKKEYIQLGRNIDTKDFHYSGGGLDIADWLTFENQTCTLDLNGKTLSLLTRMGDMPTFMRVYEGSNLTIKDSQGGGQITGEFENTGAGDRYLIHMNKSSLTLEGGTFRATAKPYGTNVNVIDYLESNVTIKDGVTISQPEHYAYGGGGSALKGHGYALCEQEREFNYGDKVSHVVIDGGIFDGWVRLIGYPDTNGSVQINGGTFKKGVQALYVAKKNNSDPTVTVNGGTFEDNVYLQDWDWKESLYMPYRLNGGTFKGTVDLHAVNNITVYQKPESNPNVALGLNECFGYSAVVTPDGTFAGPNAYTGVLKKTGDYDYDMWLKGTASNPVRIIGDAWGMTDVTLNGDPIDYAKDWNGAAKEIDNSKDQTITFKWKDLATELVKAGYSYDAKCEHYISGASGVQQTDTIAAGKTSHTITIEKGADPKVYSFDLKLNLEKNGNLVGIVHNQHIVKLVVKPAEVPEPDPTIDGTVYYTSGIVFGSPISIAASVTPAEATKSYQWQRSTDGGDTWKNIDGETSGSYTPVAADMGDTVRIRVVVTAEGYLGEIVGAPLKVNKAANNEYPEVIKLEAVQDEAGAYTGFKINNYDPNCEYVYSKTDKPDWSKNQIGSDTVTELESNKTYYVFARFEETKTHTAGSIVSKNSIMLYDYVPLQYVLLEGYDSGETIYIKQGESVTLKVSADPSNANSWQEITFKDDSNTTSSHITISNGKINANTETATTFPNGYTITIKGDSKGSANLKASYPGQASNAYGTWPVVVYDETNVEDALRLENVYTYADITLSKNDEAKLPTDLPKLLPENSGYHLEWRILKGGTTGGYTHVTENDNIELDGSTIKPKAAHDASGKTQLELVAVKNNSDEYRTLPKTSLFYVTVAEAPVIELTGVTVTPTMVNLEIGKDIQLSAVREPVNATGDLSWSSDKPDIATVDNTGKVTAKGQGTAKITVTCGDEKATCTVLVDHKHSYEGQTWQPMGPGLHSMECVAHDYSKAEPHKFSEWTDNNDDKTHTGTCTECGYEKTENHSWVVDHEDAPTANAEGTRYYKCSATGCTATKTESIPMLTEYSVTVNTDGNGTASASPAKAVAGTEITLSAKAKSGYHFKEWQVVKGGMTITNNKFTMPADDVEVKAIFEKNASTGTGTGATTYPITVKSAKNGDVTASHKSASKGTTITLTVDPDKGYLLDTLTVLDGKDKEIKLTEKNGKYTFTMPDSKVTVAATFKAEQSTGNNPFTDVPAGAYYEDAVVWAVGRNITTGMSATTFDPNGSCTRAQIVTFLWRAAGSPEPKTMKGFDDVASNAYYAKAVAWAVENGITTGTSASKFSPNDPCTRTQAVTFLFRYAAANGMEAVTMQELLSGYADAASVPSYAVSAMNWALAAGILQGDGVKLMPNATCTRAQIVTFLYRAMK